MGKSFSSVVCSVVWHRNIIPDVLAIPRTRSTRACTPCIGSVGRWVGDGEGRGGGGGGDT